MSAFPIDEAELLALSMESVAWSIQLMTFIFCIWAFTARSQTQSRRLINWPFVYAFVLFDMGTMHVCLSLYRALDAFVYNKSAGDAVSMLSQWSNTVRIVHVSSALFTGGICIM